MNLICHHGRGEPHSWEPGESCPPVRDQGEQEPSEDGWGPMNTAPRGKVRILAEKCSTCIFHPGNRMHLEPGRVKEMVEGSLENDSAIICHSTLGQEEQAVCRGFYEAHKTTPLQIAERLGLIEEVEVTE